MDSWQRYQHHLVRYADLGFSLDVSQMGIPEGFLESKLEAAAAAYTYMRELEAGEVKNVDEGRMVGHYWLRDASLAPEPSIRSYIDTLPKESMPKTSSPTCWSWELVVQRLALS